MASIVDLRTGIAECVRDGDVVALEGFSHLVPFAAGHEILRQERANLTLSRLSLDLVGDQMIGAGAVSRVLYAWAGNPLGGTLRRLRDADENGWPQELAVEEHSHGVMANRYAAGAAGLSCAVIRDTLPDAARVSSFVGKATCPFTGDEISVVRALVPDVTIVHAQRADQSGNVQAWGVLGVQREAVLAAQKTLVTVEEIVPELPRIPGATILPGWAVTFVALAPGGATPSAVAGFYDRDDAVYRTWRGRSETRSAFGEWLDAMLTSDGPSVIA